ncbi:1-(5-phosphoribosyl)-5-[(5-phosphoribosylamino)methylideneamino] imidazole-4-carboxamide isomerase [Rubripirellula lacrimiformis]|uniref:1-(5-phosphoribosyl)-5-[(5-phosphoribosylamino)methylideneamino] imidazole-4-carboxamide isomerase n=2 Tax=Rubripirellula lacrimiformis TaxID=1930273 RepID=A0A517N930_9BACT|nr:1-(5-phosphoribosyl)-5-[(5-phosphoribosylamino)methylideneamino] imidazole-4-carboxamide isomerase [Rubripirellula lacrimiformis]
MAVADSIIGVIDLKNGQSVHAVAGLRDQYRPANGGDGSPTHLASHYRSIGVDRLYIADLDSIQFGRVSVDVIAELLDIYAGCEVLVDLGWRNPSRIEIVSAMNVLVARSEHVSFIAATESAESLVSVPQMADIVPADRCFLGLDFRNGQLNVPSGSQADWIDAAADARFAGVVVLDVAEVGMRRGPVTATRCREIADDFPQFRVYTGGGIRSLDDAKRLVDAGCRGCLVGTALLPQH